MSAILSPETIDPFGLPSLPLADRRQLPCCPGIYFKSRMQRSASDVCVHPSIAHSPYFSEERKFLLHFPPDFPAFFNQKWIKVDKNRQRLTKEHSLSQFCRFTTFSRLLFYLCL
jgi:hypothetical protein